ncbi:hypothetical protein M422DRAFT_65921 [Sphaerobolus stellatus SS14]|nr:hypothetical protein M422DRAFT_65921 [Sphaerobolus stellatus SS14]
MAETQDGHNRNQTDDFQFLTEFALLDNNDSSTWASSSKGGKTPQDGLFLERLETFLEGQMKEIETFASREGRPLEEIRRLVALPHVKHLFSQDLSLPKPEDNGVPSKPSLPSLKLILSRISRCLRVLHSTAALESLLLVVSPATPPTDSAPESLASESSWIGGSELGKEFWMGIKGGGLSGARAFRIKSQMQHKSGSQDKDLDANVTANASEAVPISAQTVVPPTPRKVTGKDIKTELNAAVRQALRLTSGKPDADMRWTKPQSMEDLYEVRLVGWPSSVSFRNPSNNSLKENKLLLDYVRTGKLKFVKKGTPEWDDTTSLSSSENASSAGPKKSLQVQAQNSTSNIVMPSSQATIPISSLRSTSSEVPVDTAGDSRGSSQKRPQSNPDSDSEDDGPDLKRTKVVSDDTEST